jgi:hypothetical protein
MTTVGLAMIVRDEEFTLPRLAPTLMGSIDHWTIVDTGSTDNTVEVAREVFGYAPGTLIEDEWRGFGPSRNVAFEAAEPYTDWLLTIDADDTLHGQVEDAELVNVDALHAEYRFANLRYWLPRLVRSGQGWRWKGRAHEYLCAPERGRSGRTQSFWVEHHADGGSRPGKFEREVSLLTEDWAESPGDPRTAFYLARSYDDAGEARNAILWYHQRLRLGGWAEESFYARYRLGACLLRAGEEEGAGQLWRAWGERPHRVEPLALLAEHYRGLRLWHLAWSCYELALAHQGGPTDALFVDASAQWRVAYEASITAWYVGEFDRGAQLMSELLGRQDLPEGIRRAVEENRRFYPEVIT